ncbi:MAG: hypothetical protein E6370_08460 [Clostridiales bacterium]|nr:hypothetical protein [Clostridiales bacterium]MDU6974343.1 hypothetical protein [Clostridiales bacterium]
MYKIAYLDKDIELVAIDEVIDLITTLVKRDIYPLPYFLSITLNNKNIICFGIGATPNHIIVFFKPYSVLEDNKISRDTSQSYENSPVIKFLYPHSTHSFECNEYNLLLFDSVIPHLHSLLIDGDMSCIPCYSY